MSYLIITAGYWGKGETLNEAAKNACVPPRFVRGRVFKLDPRLYTKAEVDGMGGILRHMTDELADAPRPLQGGVRDTSDWGYFNLKMTKGNLSMTVIPEPKP